MDANSTTKANEAAAFGQELFDSIISWSLDDIRNDKPNEIISQSNFSSKESYSDFFRCSLLEDIRAGLHSNMEKISRLASDSKILSIKMNRSVPMMYRICIKPFNSDFRRRYRPRGGDILALSSVRPRSLSDLQSNGSSGLTLALVMNGEDDEYYFSKATVMIKAAKQIGVGEGKRLSLRFAVCLLNITTYNRIWMSFRMGLSVINMNIIQDGLMDDIDPCRQLNQSLKMEERCDHKHRILKLILGSPGTEKTEAMTTLLCALAGKSCRTITSAQTNIEVLQIASALLQLLKSSRNSTDSVSLGDVVIYGNRVRTKIEKEEDHLQEICLQHRVNKLEKCFAGRCGFNFLLKALSSFLRHAAYYYDSYRKNNIVRLKKKEIMFREFTLKEFTSLFMELKNQAKMLCLHLPSTFISEEKREYMVAAVRLLESFLHLLRSTPEDDNDELTKFFSSSKTEVAYYSRTSMGKARLKCLEILEQVSIPTIPEGTRLEQFCLENATIVICTSAKSFDLRSLMEMDPLELSELKECQLFVMKLASEVLGKAGFGPSRFQRRVSSGYEQEELLPQVLQPQRMQLSICNKMSQNGGNSIFDIEEIAIAYEEMRDRAKIKRRRR